MGFFSGVITGVAVAAGAAVWYMCRSGSRVREQYRFEERLGELGDQLEVRTRDIQATVNAQLADMKAKGQADGSTNGHGATSALDDATRDRRRGCGHDRCRGRCADDAGSRSRPATSVEGGSDELTFRAARPRGDGTATCADVRWFARPHLAEIARHLATIARARGPCEQESPCENAK